MYMYIYIYMHAPVSFAFYEGFFGVGPRTLVFASCKRTHPFRPIHIASCQRRQENKHAYKHRRT